MKRKNVKGLEESYSDENKQARLKQKRQRQKKKQK